MLVYYCQKCSRQNPRPQCEECGRALGNPSVRFVWEDSRPAIADPARIGLLIRIAMAAVVMVVVVMLLMEYVLQGPSAFTFFFKSTGILPAAVGLGLAFIALGVTLLFLQGKESVQYMLDPKGVLKRTWIEPTRIKCWSRFLRYNKRNFMTNNEGRPFLLAHEQYLLWQDAARYRLAPRSGRITLYRPYAFIYMNLHLPPYEYQAAAEMVAAKLKNKR